MNSVKLIYIFEDISTNSYICAVRTLACEDL